MRFIAPLGFALSFIILFFFNCKEMLKRTFEGVFLPPQASKSRISHPETCCLQQMWAPIPQAAEGWEQVSKRGLQQHIPLTL